MASVLTQAVALVALAALANAHLSPYFYDNVCPQALPTIRNGVRAALRREARLGASILRLSFHDCFGRKPAFPNVNSLMGFEVIDDIKEAVNQVCNGNVVSCADVLVVAARDSVVELGGPFWDVALGRRDSRTASKDDANTQLASPFDDLPVLISNFQSHGLSVRDLVALLGTHTIGFSRCLFFRDRIFNESNIHPLYAAFRQRSCPQSGGDDSLAALDTLSSNRFDNGFFGELVNNRGLLHSDQELFNGSRGPTDSLVWQYSRDWRAFLSDFSDSMMRLGNLGVLTGSQGEVRVNCRKPN
ncbi:hypothetical protein AMTRI_Chr08g167810 [Amborella trichopoda]